MLLLIINIMFYCCSYEITLLLLQFMVQSKELNDIFFHFKFIYKTCTLYTPHPKRTRTFDNDPMKDTEFLN